MVSFKPDRRRTLGRRVWAARELYLLLLLPIVWYFVFKYIPIYGVQIAFRDYRPVRGFFGSEWVGMKHFERFFHSFYFERVVGNTLVINFVSLLVGLSLIHI